MHFPFFDLSGNSWGKKKIFDMNDCRYNVGIDFGTSSICIAILDKNKNDISIATKKKNFPYIE